jgi:hypothetical protein
MDRNGLRKAGFRVPIHDIYITGSLFWELINEGWKLLLDEHGKVLAYVPPSINHWLIERAKKVNQANRAERNGNG